MPFEDYDVVLSAPKVSGSGFAATLKPRKNKTATLVFTLTTAVAAELGWGDGDILQVQLGIDVHHGFIRLRKNASVGKAVVRKRGAAEKSYFTIDMGHMSAFVDRKEAKLWCGFTKQAEAWVEVKLPSWAAESAKPAVRQLVAPPASRPALGPPVQSTSRSLPLGDPPPERSALANRLPPPAAKRAVETGPGKLRDAAAAKEDKEYIESAGQRQRRSDNEVQILAAIAKAFGATTSESVVVFTMLDGRVKTREVLFNAVYPNGGDDVEIRIIDSFISRLRRKMATRMVNIETDRGHGYSIDKKNLELLKAILNIDEVAGS